MDKEVIALARYWLSADLLESRATALPLTDEELEQLEANVQELAGRIERTIDGYFEQLRRLEIARRAVKEWK